MGFIESVLDLKGEAQQTLLVHFRNTFTYLAFALRYSRRSLQIVNAVFVNHSEVEHAADLGSVKLLGESIVSMGLFVVFLCRQPGYIHVQRLPGELIVSVDDVFHEFKADTLIVSIDLTGTHNEIDG